MQSSLFQYSLKLTSLPAVGMEVQCASLGDWLPSAAGNALPMTLLMSAALSRLQKLSGTCTPDVFAPEPLSCEHPHAVARTASVARQRVSGLAARRVTVIGIFRSLQHPSIDQDGTPGHLRGLGPRIRLPGETFRFHGLLLFLDGYTYLIFMRAMGSSCGGAG